MSMSDCSECWETPCCCGHDYKHWDNQKIYQHISMLVKVLTEKEKSPLQPIVDKIKETSRRNGIK